MRSLSPTTRAALALASMTLCAVALAGPTWRREPPAFARKQVVQQVLVDDAPPVTRSVALPGQAPHQQRGRDQFPVFVLSLDGTKLGVLESLFDEEPLYIPVSSAAGGVEAAMNPILVAMGKRLPAEVPPTPQPQTSWPVVASDTWMTLSAPGMPSSQEKVGTGEVRRYRRRCLADCTRVVSRQESASGVSNVRPETLQGCR